jgi:hypothetical protein
MQSSLIREAKEGNYVIAVAFLLSSSLSIYFSAFLSLFPSALSLISFFPFILPFVYFVPPFLWFDVTVRCVKI